MDATSAADPHQSSPAVVGLTLLLGVPQRNNQESKDSGPNLCTWVW